MCKAKTYEYVKQEINKTSYKLLSTSYKNNKSKLSIRCKENFDHIFEMCWTCFRRGQRCPKCFGNEKLTYEYVKQEIDKTGYKLLSTSYKNAWTKLSIQCKNDPNHIFKMSWSNFEQRSYVWNVSDSTIN